MDQIKHLLVIAGPSCAGKSTFLKNFANGAYPDLVSELNIGDLSDWTTIYGKDVEGLRHAGHRKLLLQYALPFLALSRGTLAGYAHDTRLEILGRADKLTIVSLFADRKSIRKRIRKRLAKAAFARCRRPFSPAPRRETHRLVTLNQLYNDPDFRFESVCKQWIDYSDALPPHRHILINFSAGPRLVSKGLCGRQRKLPSRERILHAIQAQTA
ncbi:MAG: hypothetical protein U9R74_09300 [Pseudomonadota bacterium]|nr:hypothetical protein [Pseudomonadota bacterium]